MKHFLKGAFLAGALCAQSLLAQIQITQSNLQFVAGTYETAFTSGKDIISGQKGANFTWVAKPVDSFAAVDPTTYVTSPLPQFAGTLWSPSFELLAGGAGVDTYTIFASTQTGYKQVGIALDEQKYSLNNLTGNPNDSLLFAAQLAQTTGELTYVAYPATVNSSWRSNYRYQINGTMTITLAGIVSTPVAKAAHITQTDSVVGWGKIQIPTSQNGLSDFYDVLMVKTHYKQVDSFYLAGQPFPDQLAAALGIQQGAETEMYALNFWRGSMMPIAGILYYSDSTYSTASPDYIFDHSVPAKGTSVQELSDVKQVVAYPNPARDNVVVSFEQSRPEMVQVEIRNIMGELVQKVPVMSPAYRVEVPISLDGIARGAYSYSVVTSDGKRLATGKFIVTE